MTPVAQPIASMQRFRLRINKRSNGLGVRPPDLFTDASACYGFNPKPLARTDVWSTSERILQASEAAIPDRADFRPITIDPEEPSLYDGTTKTFRLSRQGGSESLRLPARTICRGGRISRRSQHAPTMG
jgi:hypothetical protein